MCSSIIEAKAFAVSRVDRFLPSRGFAATAARGLLAFVLTVCATLVSRLNYSIGTITQLCSGTSVSPCRVCDSTQARAPAPHEPLLHLIC